MRVAYLGPSGTFSEDALRQSGFGGSDFTPVLCDTVSDVVSAVSRGEADRALAPIENSIEGSIRPTLDGLAEAAAGTVIVGEYDHEIRSGLIARRKLELDEIDTVISHPQPLAQCARFLREALPNARPQVADSTASAVKLVQGSDEPWAALAPVAAAAVYGCEVLATDIEDEPGNTTRFVWLAPAGTAPDESQISLTPWKTTVVFSELGADHPGALVDALLEFSKRDINLARIESRPARREIGRYRFFIDVEGRADDEQLAEAIEALRTKAESVQVLGSYRAA